MHIKYIRNPPPFLLSYHPFYVLSPIIIYRQLGQVELVSNPLYDKASQSIASSYSHSSKKGIKMMRKGILKKNHIAKNNDRKVTFIGIKSESQLCRRTCQSNLPRRPVKVLMKSFAVPKLSIPVVPSYLMTCATTSLPQQRQQQPFSQQTLANIASMRSLQNNQGHQPTNHQNNTHSPTNSRFIIPQLDGGGSLQHFHTQQQQSTACAAR